MLRTAKVIPALVLVVAVCALAVNQWGCGAGENATAGNQDSNKTGQYKWKTIGTFTCHGVLDSHPDPNNPDKYIITWQRSMKLQRQVGKRKWATNMRFSVYDARTKTFSPPGGVFNFGKIAASQGHPCWGYSHGKYRVFYIRSSGGGRFLAEMAAEKWSGLQERAVPKDERIVTPDIAGGPMSTFLAVDDSTAWLFYGVKDWRDLDALAYSVFHKDKGWDKIRYFIPTRMLIGSKSGNSIGCAMMEGDDIVLYSSVGMGEKAGNAHRFKTSDKGKTWTAEQLKVSGIKDPFKRDIDTQLYTIVVKKGKTYYLSSQSHSSHRWLARGTDGVHFKLVADFGKRRSLSNTMVNIKGTRGLLLVYANYPHPNPKRTCVPGVEKNVEYIIYDTGESD